MAEPENIEQVIERTIRIYLEQEGSKDVANGMKAVKTEVDKVRIAAKALSDETFNLNKEMKNQARLYVQGEKIATAALKKQQQQVAKVTKSFINLGGVASGVLGEIGQGLKKIGGMSGFGNMVREAVAYDKSLLKLSSMTSRLGIGFVKLESELVSMGRATKLTRVEVISLFSEFNKSYKFASMEDFRSLLGRIQGMVGSNKEAIQEYMSAVGSLSQEYGGLAQDITRMTELDKAGAKSRVEILYLTRKIGQAQYRSLIAIVNGNKQLGPLDRIRQQQAEDRIKTIQQFKTHIVDVGVKIGQSILPALAKVADFLEKITANGENWGRGVATTVALLAGLKIGGGLLAMGGTGLAAGLTAKVAGGAFAPAFAAGGGAALGAGAGLLGGGVAIAAGEYGYRNLRETAYEQKKAGKDSRLAITGSYASGILGSAAGGAAIGAVVGSIVPIIGTALGAAVGGIGGAVVGLIRTSFGHEEFIIKKDIEESARKRAETLAERQKEFEKNRKTQEDDAKEREEQLVAQREMGVFADMAGALAGAETGRTQAEMEAMQLTGNVDTMRLGQLGARAFKSIDVENAALKEYRNNLMAAQQQRAKDLGISEEQLMVSAKTNNFSDDQLEVMDELNIKRIDILTSATEIANTEGKIASRATKRLKVMDAINNAYRGEISLAGAVADQAGLLVQIADSYAMGVGASAQMRMQEFDAIEEQRKAMQKQLQEQMKMRDSLAEGDARQKQAEIVQKTENDILQLQLKQAGITKSLRDGWIEAIGSMNTGAGTFTKIIMDQNRGTAQSLKLAGQAAVISSRSGSLRGGYRGSEKFSAMQGAAGQGLLSGGIGRRNIAYRTTMDQVLGTSTEGLQWQARQAASERLSRANRYAASGGLVGSAFGASPHYEGIVGEQGIPGATVGRKKKKPVPGAGIPGVIVPSDITGPTAGVIQVNVKLQSNAPAVAKEIADKIGAEVAGIVNVAVAKFGDSVSLA